MTRPIIKQAGLTLTLGGCIIGLLSDDPLHGFFCVVAALIGVIILAVEERKRK